MPVLSRSTATWLNVRHLPVWVHGPRSSYKYFCADLPNECWQADLTYIQLENGLVFEVLNVIDDHSRLCIASRAVVTVKAQDVVRGSCTFQPRNGAIRPRSRRTFKMSLPSNPRPVRRPGTRSPVVRTRNFHCHRPARLGPSPDPLPRQ